MILLCYLIIFIMSGVVFGYTREAVRVKVKKCDINQLPELRKFSVDPQITSFEVLQSIIAKAFDLKGDFTISFRLYDVNGYETYMPILSDWDLEAAFLKAHNASISTNTEPCLCLCVDLHPFEECPENWEVGRNLPVITQIRTAASQEAKPSPRLHGIFNQVGKTLNMVQRAFNFGEDGSTSLQPPRPPLSDTEFRRFLDPVGQIVYAKELRSVIYFGGIDPGLRKVVWKHLLNVYPAGMTGRERMDYIRRKASEYVGLRDTWKAAIAQGPVVGELAYTTSMVRKDVLRTDRHHPFYAGSDDNQNIASLFNILTTYALNHPKVSYCQGMSDLASPLLVTMNDEAHAYICFCALMQRLCTNFMIDGIAMTQKFAHLSEALMHYDPEFYNYLKLHQADDLLFCYRWLLLEMKREFAFDDSLRMLEVLWSSLPADLPEKELRLFDVAFRPPVAHASPPTVSPPAKAPRENPYTKVCALRRQGSAASLGGVCRQVLPVRRQNHSLDDAVGNRAPPPVPRSLDDAALPDPVWRPGSGGPGGRRSASLSCLARAERRAGPPRVDAAATPPRMVRNLDEFMSLGPRAAPATGVAAVVDGETFTQVDNPPPSSAPRDVFVWENPLHRPLPSPLPPPAPITNSCEEVTEAARPPHSIQPPGDFGGGNPLPPHPLPPPGDFGGGNPFLMFLCVTLLVQHRDHVMGKRMDYNEMAMHFDKMVRRHDVTRVLDHARRMYARYVKQHAMGHRNGRC